MWLLIILLVALKSNEGARILAYFPTPSLSHQVVFRPLMQELVARGHQVTIVTPDPAYSKGGAPENMTEIDIHDISYKIVKEKFNDVPRGRREHCFDQMAIIIKLFVQYIDTQVRDERFQKILDEDFDLLFLEAVARPALGLAHVFKVPVIQISSFDAYFGNYESIGAEVHEVLYPSLWRQKLYNLTLWDKVTEVYQQYRLQYLHEAAVADEDKMLKKLFGPDTPSLKELANRVDMLFLNVHPLFGGNRPVPPSAVYIGGIYQSRPAKALPPDLKCFLDKSKNGVIYMSFGTNVHPEMLPPEWIQLFVRVLSHLPYDVLWKWNTDEVPAKSKNIKFSKWFPQSDLLKHPKVKLFVTQGGLQSTEEAIYAEVPMIGIPMLADQWYNTEKYEHFKIGKQLLVENLSEDSFRNAIITILGDDSYRKNIQDLHRKFLDQPRSPLENAVWWTEHVLRQGGASHLRSPAANLPASQYYELDLLGILAVVVLTAVGIASGVMYFIYIAFKAIFGSQKSKLKKQ